MGRVERLVGALEQLQVPLAQAREVARHRRAWTSTPRCNVRDKARMKSVLQSRRGAVRAAPAGPRSRRGAGVRRSRRLPAGGQATGRRGSAGDLPARRAGRPAGLAAAIPPRPDAPGLLEEFLVGEEHTLRQRDDRRPDGVGVDRRLPARRRWRCCATRGCSGPCCCRATSSGPEYAGIHEVGPAALRALGVRDALTHMEWFRRPDGSVAVSEVAARPPGAQLTSMHGYVHDIDMYRAWAELVLLGPVRAARASLRRGHGLPAGPGPRPGPRGARGRGAAARARVTWSSRRGCRSPDSRRSSDYEGEGYVIVRDPDTEVVRDALQRIVSGIRVELVEAQ